MKIFKLYVALTLVEQTVMEENPDTTAHESPDPVKRDGEEIGKMTGLLEKIMERGFQPRTPPPSPNSVDVTRTFDVPADTFEEAVALLKQFDSLCHQIGTPSAAGRYGSRVYPAFPVG